MKKVLMGFLAAFLCLVANKAVSQDEELKLELNEEIKNAIEATKTKLDEMRSSICNEVKDISSKAGAINNAGVMQYANYVEFVKLGNKIDDLNDKWNEYYGSLMDKLIEHINQNNGCLNCSSFKDERGDDLLFEELEEKYIIFPDDIASVCFEEMYSFRSFRNCMNEADDAYSNEIGENLDAGQAPSNQESFDDEEFWTLINCDKAYTVLTSDVDNSMFTEGETEEEKKNILTTIKDILGILGQTVNIVKELAELMKDCASSETVKDKDMRDGIKFDNENRRIGYVMVQKGVLIDFQQTVTKIKGKAKIWVKNKRGKYRKDRRAKAGVSFCAFEWDACNGKEWLSNSKPYISPIKEKRKKVKLKHYHPSALQIDKSTHFLQFQFGRNKKFVEARNLLGIEGCGPASNIGWN
jgi:hypothetical protein